MSRLCFDLSIKCRFSLLSFYVLSYNGLDLGQTLFAHIFLSQRLHDWLLKEINAK